MGDKSLKAIPGNSVVPLLEQAQEIRKTGIMDGELVRRGEVIASWCLGPQYSFTCDASAQGKQGVIPPRRGKARNG
jgi:hypothetical protein